MHARAAGVDVLVVLHPTKESVFWPRGEADPTLRRLVANEARLHQELIAALEADGIAYVDTLPVLRAATDQPYFEDVDGHLNATGHRRIAEAVAARIR
jgi:lysophospholipase L1-like esterase